jgi:ribosomal-protein-alanine N-acetyltransferase
MERVEDGALLGMMGFHHHMPHSIEVGYVLAKQYWGSGYTTEALQMLIRAAFGTQHIDRVHAFCDVENKGSGRVLEKAGMTLEGTLRGYMKRPNLSPNLRDCLMYGILRQDWEKSP